MKTIEIEIRHVMRKHSEENGWGRIENTCSICVSVFKVGKCGLVDYLVSYIKITHRDNGEIDGFTTNTLCRII